MSAARPPPVLELEVERAVLAPWSAACARILGAAPRLTRDERGPVLQFRGDDSAAYAHAIGKVRIYAAHAPVRAHLRALGYAWDERGFLTTVPTPLSFRSRLQGLGHAGGFTPEYHRIADIYMPKQTWIARQCAGALPVTVGTASFYRRAHLRRALGPLLPRAAAWREHLRYHLHGVQHDMTKHALCLHLVPAAQVRALGERVLAAWDRHPLPDPPEPLARFYENDLVAYCQSIWSDLPGPDAFAPTFELPANLRQLHAVLALRLAELARGLPGWHIETPATPPPFCVERPRAGPRRRP